MDRRTLTAIILCFGIFLGWQKLYIEPRVKEQQAQQQAQLLQQQQHQQAQTSSQPSSSASSKGSAIIQPSTPATQRASETITLSTGTGEARVGDLAKFFVGWNLKAYHQGLTAETAAVDLTNVTHQDGDLLFAVDNQNLAYLSTVQGKLEKTATGAIWKYEDANAKLEREFVANPNQNYVDVKVRAEFKNQHPNFAFFSIAASKPEGKDSEERDRNLIYFANDSIERTQLGKAELKQVPLAVRYVGTTTRYFLMALVADPAQEPKALLQPTATGGQISLVYPVTSNSFTTSFKTYFGPKELSTLRSVDGTLDHTVDFGWFTVIAYPLLNLLKWLYQYVGNYGVAIILLTILLKLVTFPLTYKSMKSMKEMAKLQPQLNRLREKYKDDKEALNREMLTVMRSHGYNPMAGCLPMLVQMPIFFALYRVLYSSIELYHAPFAFWIKDLAAHDPFYVTPVLMTALMFLQQKLTPSTATDPMQAKMLQLMPVIFGVFMLALPSGLTLYMLVNAAFSIVQQLFLNKKLDIRVPAATAGT